MTMTINRKSLARAHAALLETQLGLARWSGQAEASPQADWQRQRQQEVLDWLLQGGLAAETKTAASGRRSLASQRDSNEECEFTQLRIPDAAA